MSVRTLAVAAAAVALVIPGLGNAAPSTWSSSVMESCTTSPTSILQSNIAETAQCVSTAGADATTGHLRTHISLSSPGRGVLPGQGAAAAIPNITATDLISTPISKVTYTLTFHVTSADVAISPGNALFAPPSGWSEISVTIRHESEYYDFQAPPPVIIADQSTSTFDKDIVVVWTYRADERVPFVPGNVEIAASVASRGVTGVALGLGAGSIRLDADVTLVSLVASITP